MPCKRRTATKLLRQPKRLVLVRTVFADSQSVKQLKLPPTIFGNVSPYGVLHLPRFGSFITESRSVERPAELLKLLGVFCAGATALAKKYS